jgi:hypothetical protein
MEPPNVHVGLCTMVLICQVIYCTILLLAGDTYDLQLATRDEHEVKVHVLIYSHTQS